MPKLIWVALPVLAALAWLTLAALRGRMPSRTAINMVGSALLIVYIGTTAGLGIFWVANQQLPVFDWHYLFGYTTVLLVVLHLWFNLPILWRWLARRRRGAPVNTPAAPAATSAAPRRPLLAALGVAALSAAAFALGMRHGRSELRVTWPQGGGAADSGAASATDADMAFVERFHAFSSTSRRGVLLRAPSLDWGDAPPAFKRYPGARVALPPAAGARAGVDAAAVGSALWHTAGITARRGTIVLRASPSSGALFSTELYLAVRALPGLGAGWWHYDPQQHALHRVSDATAGAAALGAPDAPWLRDAPAVVIASAVFRRTGHKYRDRTYRYVLADLGHALENLRVAAAALGLRARLLPRFDETRPAAVLGLEVAEEGVLALITLHAAGAVLPTGAPVAAPLAPQAPHASTPSAWRAPPPPDAAGLPLGVTSAIHRASSLQVATAGAAPPHDAAAAASAAAAPAASGAIALPATPSAATRMLELIAVRRSIRRFAVTPLALADLSAVLRAMSSAAAQLSSAVRINLVAHLVAGLEPGAYRYDAATHTLAPRGPRRMMRDAARAAALDQDVIGDAAAAFVLSLDRATIAADPLGAPRGYRHAFLEAGLVGERIYLEGGARRLGVCAVGAFYDDEAAALVGIDPAREWVVHFAAIGVPA